MLLAADDIRIVYICMAGLHVRAFYEPVLYQRNVCVIHTRFVPGSRVQVAVLEPASGGQREAVVIVDTG